MTTFSQLVDEMMVECRRPDMVADISTYLNQTIRELHFNPEGGAAITYASNMREELLIAPSDQGFYWDIPNPSIFQTMQAVSYESLGFGNRPERFISERLPGYSMANKTRFWYRAGHRIFFAGYGGQGAMIGLAYYEYPRRHRYFNPNNRPAELIDDVWSYAAEFDTSDELREIARELTSNWLLQRWVDVVSEGVRAKVYKRLSDDQRARTAYSLFGQLRVGLFTSESVALTATR